MYWLLALLSLTTLAYGKFIQKDLVADGGKIWAFLVAGSNGYNNYRHQADVCHAYQVLHHNGIPDENIIVMMADDIAFNPENPTPGIILNYPGGVNVYENIPKDYTGKNVNPKNFLNVLSGNKTAMEGIETGRVIESGPNDRIFVNFVDHGGSGVLCFPNDVLHADDLEKTISKMSSRSQFSKMILYVEACFSGSTFDDILPDDLNTFVMTAADPHESSYACYFDESRQTFLGDVFSVTWLNDSEHESLEMESLHHQFERVRTLTNTSHVEEYGDLDVGSTKLSDVIGFRMQRRPSNSLSLPTIHKDDVVSNIDAPIEILNRKILAEKDEIRRKQIKAQKHLLIKKRSLVDDTFEKIINVASSAHEMRKSDLIWSKYKLGKQNYPCYKSVLKIFSRNCFNVAQNSYVRVHLPKLVNMCAVPWLSTYEVIRAIIGICKSAPIGLTGII